MDFKSFSKDEIVSILEVIQSSLACKDENDIRKLLERIKGLVCADRSICGVGTCEDMKLAEVKHIINVDYPVEWLMLYNRMKLYEKDPIIWWQAQNNGPQLWTDTYKLYREKVPKGFVDRASDFDINYGVSGGLISSSNNVASIMTFSGRDNRFKGHHKAILDILGPHVHQAMVRICMEHALKNLYHLTAREKEVVKWIKEGKSNWEISVILNISERTINFHVQNVSRKLNAVNRAHVVAIAYEQGLVS